MKIYIKKVDGITLPTQGSKNASGYDIIAISDPIIIGKKNTTDTSGIYWAEIDYIEYHTNLFIAPESFNIHTLIHPRSSISKYHLILANSIGLCDSDYRGEFICRFKYIWQPIDLLYVPSADGNVSSISAKIVGVPNMDKVYKKGDKIAQLVFQNTLGVEFELVDELNSTDRGSGGFGSSETKKISDSVKFPDHESMAEKYRQLNYIETPKKTYEQLMKEQQQSQ